jgi:hypothetical protein
MSPRFAASATPAAFCCAFDFAGMAASLDDISVDIGKRPPSPDVPGWPC